VIIGEYGCPTKGKEAASVRKFLSTVCKAAYDRGLCPVLWSTPGGHYNRETCKLEDQELKKLFNEITGYELTLTTTTTTTTITTTTTTTVTTTTTTVTSSDINGDIVYGDANCDGGVDMADVVLIMQALANPDKYGINGSDNKHITVKGIDNADVDTSSKGLTSNDALRIQEYLLHKIDTVKTA
jgi:endoglucanase